MIGRQTGFLDAGRFILSPSGKAVTVREGNIYNLIVKEKSSM